MLKNFFKTREPVAASGFNTYRRLLGYTRPYWKPFLAAIFGMVLFSLGEAGFAAVMKPLMDEGLFARNVEASPGLLSLAVLGVLLMRGIGNYLSAYYMGYVGIGIVGDLRAEMFRHLMHLPSSYFDRQPEGRILSRFTHDVEQTSMATTKALTALIRSTLTIIALFGWMLYLNWMMTLGLLVLAVPIVMLVRFSGRQFRKASRKLQDAYAWMNGNIQQAVKAQAEIKVAGAQDYEYGLFERSNERLQHHKLRLTQAKAVNVPTVMIISGVSIIFVVYISQVEFIAQAISVGTFVSFLVAMLLIFRPLRSLVNFNAVLQQGIVGAAAAFAFLDEPRESSRSSATRPAVKGHIVFNKVSLRYPDGEEEALHDVDLEIKAGESIALVGRSGSGKSSLVNLIPRLYEPTSGVVMLDGCDLSRMNLADLRDSIAYAGQHTVLIRSSVSENVAYGSEASHEAVVKAADLAHAREFIDRLPQGFDTVIHDGTLSGGQAQRISIARALLKNSPILIFDEITSALDYTTEQHIRTAFREVSKGRTTIVVTHRFSMVDCVDRIIVLQQGRIVEEGSHGTLLQQGGVYSGLYRDLSDTH